MALLWANIATRSYESTWTTVMSIRVGSAGVTLDLRHWINEGLMTLFFLVVGLEAKRELDLGELRERRRIVLPAAAAVGGMLVPIAIYLAFNAGGSGGTRMGGGDVDRHRLRARRAGAADPAGGHPHAGVPADARGVRRPRGARGDRGRLHEPRLRHGARGRGRAVRRCCWRCATCPWAAPPASVVVAVALWVAMLKSGIDPLVSGLAVGLVTSAYPPERGDLERASALARSFREQPTPELARSVQRGVTAAISANERMQYELHPWVSYVVLPLFALANAGVHITGGLLEGAIESPVFFGIVVGYAARQADRDHARQLGRLAARTARTAPADQRADPVRGGDVRRDRLHGLAADLEPRLHGVMLEEAKLAVLCTLVLAPLLTWSALWLVKRLPTEVRARQIRGTAEDIPDLTDDVDPERDHIRGPEDAPVTLLEYGDFECPYCGQAEQTIRELLVAQGTDVRYVWRHLPLNDVHPFAQLAAEASEAAAAQGSFWEMSDTLLGHQGELRWSDLMRYAEELGLDVGRFTAGAARRRVRRPHPRRRGQRRRERRHRHAHLLHQRTPPLRPV